MDMELLQTAARVCADNGVAIIFASAFAAGLAVFAVGMSIRRRFVDRSEAAPNSLRTATA